MTLRGKGSRSPSGRMGREGMSVGPTDGVGTMMMMRGKGERRAVIRGGFLWERRGLGRIGRMVDVLLILPSLFQLHLFL